MPNVCYISVMNDLSAPEYLEFAEYLTRLRRLELIEFLEEQREPIWECELMRVACPEADLISGAPLEMYRWHFVLFHVLYSLVEEFARRGLYLYIHFMRTCVKPFPGNSACRHFTDESAAFCGAPCGDGARFCTFHFQRIDETAIDSLSERYFYLDWKNFTALSAETAEKFMGGAWQLLQNHEDYRHCLTVMGLPEGVSLDLLKKRFRYLAKTMHPDVSAGHHEEFARINVAYRRLLGYLVNC